MLAVERPALSDGTGERLVRSQGERRVAVADSKVEMTRGSMRRGQNVQDGWVAMVGQGGGAPALSVPAGLARRLPVGLDLDWLPGSDSELLDLSIAIEKAISRIPPPSPR